MLVNQAFWNKVNQMFQEDNFAYSERLSPILKLVNAYAEEHADEFAELYNQVDTDVGTAFY